MKGMNVFLLVVMTCSLLPPIIADTIIPIYVRGKTPYDSINYTFNFSNTSNCDSVFFSDNYTINIDSEGLGFASINITDMPYAPYYMCEYQDDVLYNVHNWASKLFVGDEIIFNDGSVFNGSFPVCEATTIPIIHNQDLNTTDDVTFNRVDAKIINATRGNFTIISAFNGSYGILINETDMIVGYIGDLI